MTTMTTETAIWMVDWQHSQFLRFFFDIRDKSALFNILRQNVTIFCIGNEYVEREEIKRKWGTVESECFFNNVEKTAYCELGHPTEGSCVLRSPYKLLISAFHHIFPQLLFLSSFVIPITLIPITNKGSSSLFKFLLYQRSYRLNNFEQKSTWPL